MFMYLVTGLTPRVVVVKISHASPLFKRLKELVLVDSSIKTGEEPKNIPMTVSTPILQWLVIMVFMLPRAWPLRESTSLHTFYASEDFISSEQLMSNKTRGSNSQESIFGRLHLHVRIANASWSIIVLSAILNELLLLKHRTYHLFS